MKTFVFVLLIAAAVYAAPPKPASGEVSVLSKSFANDGNTYNFAFEQSDGQKREEQGEIKVIFDSEFHICISFSINLMHNIDKGH